ncbi:MAG: oxidative damage protection protein [Polyangiales bacterium]
MPQADPQRLIHCIKLQRELPGLAKPPFSNDLGKLIYERVSKEAWDAWLKESVRYINTYRVDLSSAEGTEFMIKQMKIYFGFEEGEMAATAWTPPTHEGE